MNVLVPGALFIGGITTAIKGWKNDSEKKFLTGIGITLTSFVVAGIFERYRQVPFDVGEGKAIWLYRYANKISLPDCPHLTNAHLEQLKTFTKMKELTIKGAPKITFEGLAVLKECPKLDRLPFDVGGGKLISLDKMMKEISLTNYPHLTNAHLKQFKAVSWPAELTLDGVPQITCDGLLALTESPGLYFLAIKNCPKIIKLKNGAIPDTVVDHLAKQFPNPYHLIFQTVTAAKVYSGNRIYYFEREVIQFPSCYAS